MTDETEKTEKGIKSETTGERSSESVSDAEKCIAIAKDLVELAVQTQKVLVVSSIPYPSVEEARLLAIMTNQIIDTYTKGMDENDVD